MEQLFNKKTVFLLFSFFLFFLLPIITFAQGGTTGPLTWQITGNTLTISGTGAMPDYLGPNTPWFPYQEDIEIVDIQNGVTTIGDYAFALCTSLASVDISNSVTTIGEYAFGGCSLTSVDIPNSVTTIRQGAFSQSSSLISVTIPNSVTTIGIGAFIHCSSLLSVTIPNSITTIGELVFGYCSSLISVTIPNSVTTIGSNAFVLCSSLTSVTIPNSVTTIGVSAFSGSDLISVTIPNSVTTIGVNAFGEISNLTTINVDDGNPVFVSEDGILFNKDKTRLIQYPMGITDESYSIPNSVTTIESKAFSSSRLLSVTIPNSVTTIESMAFYKSSLLSVTIPNNVITIGSSAFSGLDNLQTVNYNAINCVSSSTSVLNGLFNPPTFTTLNIGNEVQTIPAYAFRGCNKLTSITIHAQNPPTLGSYAFMGVPVNKPVNIPCLSYNSYRNASGWNNFTNFIIPTANSFSYSAKCYFPYSDDYFTNLTQAGTYKTIGVLPGNNCESHITLKLLDKQLPEVCMVTVDESNHNEIVWKSYETDLTYHIYREGTQSGQYDLVATIPPNSSNSWLDMESDAKIRSYRYKVSDIDACGKESIQSNDHKTMHLTINAGPNNSWNLIWTAYEGTAYSTYNIYRTLGDTPGEFQLIGTMPSGNTSFSDFSAPAGYVYYIIEIMLNENCDIGKVNSYIKSNIATNNPNVGIDDFRFTSDDLRIYPNPTTGELRISTAGGEQGGWNNYELKIKGIEVFDIYGRALLSFASLISLETTINISELPTGIYFLRITTEQGEVMRKVVKE